MNNIRRYILIVFVLVCAQHAGAVSSSGSTSDFQTGQSVGNYSSSIEKATHTYGATNTVGGNYSLSVSGQSIATVDVYRVTLPNTWVQVAYHTQTGPGALAGTWSASYTEGQKIVIRAYGQVQVNPSVTSTTQQSEFTWSSTDPNAPTKKVTVSLFNSRDYPVSYKLMGGSPLAQIGSTVTLQPHTGLIQTFQLPPGIDESTLQVVSIIEGYDFTDGQWTVEEGAVKTEVVKSGITASQTPPVASDDVVIPVAEPSQAPSGAVPTATTGTSVWRADAPATSPELLTKSVYREGVDKVAVRIDKTNTKIDALAGHAKKSADQADRQKQIDDDAPTMQEMGTQGQAAASAVQSAFDGAGVPSSASAKVPASINAPDFSVSMPAKFGGATFDLDPFQSSRFAAICAWVKAAFLWLLGVYCFRDAFTEASALIRHLMQLRQARGNTVAGTGGQITGLIAAAAMSVALLAALVAVLGYVMQDVGLGTMASLWSANPYAGLPGGVAYMLDQVFPLGAAVVFLLIRPIMQVGMLKIYGGAAAVVRFIVP
jgi:hypothetical protein